MKAKSLLAIPLMMLLMSFPVQAHDHENWTVDEKVEKMKKEFNLNDEQAGKVRPIIADFKEKKERLHQEKMEKLQDVLTPEQMNKLREKKAKEDKKN